MKFSDYIAPLLKWWWLIILSAILAAIPAYLITRPQPPVFLARTTLVVGRAISDPNPSTVEISLAQQLAQAYAGIATREPVREATMKALELDKLPTYYAYAVPNSPFLEIRVTDIDPARAQIVATELANQLIQKSPTAPQMQEQDRVQFINEQLAYLKQKILDTQEEISQKQQALANATSAFQVSELNDEIQGLETKLSLLQANYATLVSSTESGAINTLSILEPASLPTIPIGPNKRLIIIMATLGGMIFAVGAAYLIEFLDKTLRTPEQIHRLVPFPVIGYIGDAGRSGWKHVIESPRSMISESFRSIRTNIEFSGVDEPIRTLLVTSTDAGDGKTLIASNLALVLSQTEKKVILFDCDLRKPNVHRALDLKSKPGLSEVFREHSPIVDAIQEVKGQNLAVITAGSIPPNPAELLSSKRMKQILETLYEIYDIVVIDCAPLMTTDALILSALADGVVIVTRYAHTTENALQTAAELLKRANTRIVGLILNRIPRGHSSLAARYYANGYYGHTEEDLAVINGKPEGIRPKRGLLSGTPSIRNIFRKPKKDVEVNLIADDYLFTRMVSNNTAEDATPAAEKPQLDSKAG